MFTHYGCQLNDVRANDHYVGTNLFFLDRVSTMTFRDPGMNLTWTMMLYSRADINNVLVSGEIFMYTDSVPSFCLLATAVELFDSTGMTLFLKHCFQIPMVQK